MKFEVGSRWREALPANPLIPVVGALSPLAREAVRSAATTWTLQRGTWDRCALNRAAAVLGSPVRSFGRAAKVLRTRRRAIVRFVNVWDRLPGTDAACTRLLLEALDQVEGSPEGGPPAVQPTLQVGGRELCRAQRGAPARVRRARRCSCTGRPTAAMDS
jgi:hypothetical protein